MVNKTTDLCDLITDLDYGQVHQELSRELSELIAAVEEHGKAGSMTLTINVRPEGQMALVQVASSVKAPKKPYNASMFYYGESGSLHREDPRQMSLRGLEPPKLATVGGNDDSDGAPF